MRIVVNDIAASGGGALTILESLHEYVRKSQDGNEWVFLLGTAALEESARIRTVALPEVKKSWVKRLAFDTISGRRLLASLHPDVVLSLQNTITYGVRCPQVVYVHQSLPFQKTKNFSLRRRDERVLAIYQHIIGAMIKDSVHRASHVIVQTEWMRNAILDQVDIADERIDTVSPELEDLSAYRHGGEVDSRAFFYPTSDHSYKNNECVEEACRLLEEECLTDFKVTMTISSGRAPNVEAIGRISRAEVLARLSQSTLIFPSTIETYGLPLAEARALGSIVLAADLAYAREVLNGYANAHFFDPASPAELAGLMRQVVGGEIARLTSASEIPRDSGWERVVEIVESCGRDGRRSPGRTRAAAVRGCFKFRPRVRSSRTKIRKDGTQCVPLDSL